ncbi:hypothetical protein [Fibrisoma limi]|nr:hypothetical protein [Fibrisoma limi]
MPAFESMPFKNLTIRYQTARSLPAPYAHFYTLSARTAFNEYLQVDFSITYLDRESVDEDELIAEGYTPNDDFSWSGRLGTTWQQAVANLADQTALDPLVEDQLGEDEDFFEMKLETEAGIESGTPRNGDDWTYLAQELIQAAYEAGGREQAFELTFLDASREADTELFMRASFVERNVKIDLAQNRRRTSKTLPWSELQRIMGTVYKADYEAHEPLTQRPKRNGQWLNLGGEEWYDVSDETTIVDLFRKL